MSRASSLAASRHLMCSISFLLLCCFLLAMRPSLGFGPAPVLVPDEDDHDPEMEARARELLAELSTEDANDPRVAGQIEVLRQILGEDADCDQLLTEEEVMERFAEAGLSPAQIEEAKKL